VNDDFQIGDRVTWMTVKGPQIGSIARFDERGIVIHLEDGKAILAHKSSLTKVR